MNILQNFDLSVIEALYHIHEPILDKIMIFFTDLGNTIWVVITIWLLINKKTRKTGLKAAAALIIFLLIVNVGLKPFFHRTRPFKYLKDIVLLIPEPSSFSFPSAHTASAFTMVYIFYKDIKKYFPGILILAILISLSRLYLSVHFPTDVMAGIGLGLFSGFLGNSLINNFEFKGEKQ